MVEVGRPRAVEKGIFSLSKHSNFCRQTLSFLRCFCLANCILSDEDFIAPFLLCFTADFVEGAYAMFAVLQLAVMSPFTSASFLKRDLDQLVKSGVTSFYAAL